VWSRRVKIWKADEAPKSLRTLYIGPAIPEWIALVPGSLGGKDLDDMIVANVGDANLFRYTRPNGDTVYIGMSDGVGYCGVPSLLNFLSTGQFTG
jgi:hypothetical protein